MLKALTVRELSKAISSAKATEYAVVADAARVIAASGLATATLRDTITVEASLRRDHHGIKGAPMTGAVVQCVIGSAVFGLVPFFGPGATRGRWLVLGDATRVGQAIHGMISNDHPGDPVKLVRRVAREIVKREAHIRAMC